MADEPEFTQAAVAWLRETWGDEKPCPFCGNPEWSVLVPVELTLRKDMAGEQYSGLGITAVPVVCTNCGFIAHISATRAGIVQPTPVPDPSSKETNE